MYVFKYPPYVTDLKQQLVDLFYEGIIQKEYFISSVQDSVLLVPIPLHPTKFRKRGYNQSALLAQGLAMRLSLPVYDCLICVKQTKPQVSFSKDDRKANMADAFMVKPEARNLATKYKTVILVDDVVTSGATLKEAATVLKKANFVHVWGITLAHGE